MASQDDVGGTRVVDEVSPPDAPPPRRTDRVRGAIRLTGELLITLGLVVLLFVVYEVYVTDLISAGKQRDATSALDDQWKQDTGQQRVEHFDGLAEGSGFAKMYVPALGADYHFTIIEGTTESSLEIGPGHYTGTAYPGEPGNFSIAGHRVGKGAPFNDVDLLQSCDAIIVETEFNWFVYRVLPMQSEVGDWAQIKASRKQCNVMGPQGKEETVEPLAGDYASTVGQEIVLPRDGSVIAAVPHHADSTLAKAQQKTLMTLTTCNPKFSDRQRLIVHAVFVAQWAKDPAHPGSTPPELKELS